MGLCKPRCKPKCNI